MIAMMKMDGIIFDYCDAQEPQYNTFNIQIAYRFQSGKSKVPRKQNEMDVESRISGGMAEF